MAETRVKLWHDGEEIIHEGTVNDEMYKIISGQVILYFRYGKPDEYLVGILSERRCFGEVGVLCGKPAIFTAVALGDVYVMQINREEFDGFLQNNYQNVLDIMKGMADKLTTMKCNVDILNYEVQKNYQDKEIKTKAAVTRLNRYSLLDPNNPYNMNRGL